MSTLRELRRQKGLSMEALAKLLDTSASQINKLEKGQRKLTEEWLRRLAVALQCNPGDLIDGGLGAGRPRVGLDPNEFVFVPVCDLSRVDREGPGAGTGHFLNHAIFRIDWLAGLTTASVDQLVAFTVEDDSMEPGMRPGDHVLVELTQDQMRGDGVYVLRMGGGLAIKRIAYSPESGRISIRSDNPIYPSHDSVSREKVRLVGRIVWIGRRF